LILTLIEVGLLKALETSVVFWGA